MKTIVIFLLAFHSVVSSAEKERGGGNSLEAALTQARVKIARELSNVQNRLDKIAGFSSEERKQVSNLLVSMLLASRSSELIFDRVSREPFSNSSGVDSWIQTSAELTDQITVGINIRTAPRTMVVDTAAFYYLHELAHKVPWIGVGTPVAENKAWEAATLIQRAIFGLKSTYQFPELAELPDFFEGDGRDGCHKQMQVRTDPDTGTITVRTMHLGQRENWYLVCGQSFNATMRCFRGPDKGVRCSPNDCYKIPGTQHCDPKRDRPATNGSMLTVFKDSILSTYFVVNDGIEEIIKRDYAPR